MARGVRVDQALVDRGLVRSRSLARRLIEDGAVSVVLPDHRETVGRPSRLVAEEARLEIADSRESRFASRAGTKLEGAIDAAGIDCAGVVALDVGQSTGGFTDCLLGRGAAGVVGIEVGHGQLVPSLRADPRVRCFEHAHVGRIDPPRWLATHGIEPFDLVVTDLSFISSLALLARLAEFARNDATLLMLVKPQFELGPQAVGRGGLVGRRGVVDDAADRALGSQAFAAARSAGWEPLRWFASGLRGSDGNQEYFLHARRQRPIVPGVSTS